MSKRPDRQDRTNENWTSALEAVVRYISAKPALLAATVVALSCAEYAGALAAQEKPVRSETPAVAIGMPLRGAQNSDPVRPSKATSSYKQRAKQKQQARRAARNAALRKLRDRLASKGASPNGQISMLGLASFYSDDCDTASGERFDKSKLNAAHRSLPFGTRLLVTNVVNGKSVMVRVNDRGPFVRGRIIDVTSAAAEALGMLDVGIIKVTLAIVR
jgi:rare lipoprotein A